MPPLGRAHHRLGTAVEGAGWMVRCGAGFIRGWTGGPLRGHALGLIVGRWRQRAAHFVLLGRDLTHTRLVSFLGSSRCLYPDGTWPPVVRPASVRRDSILYQPPEAVNPPTGLLRCRAAVFRSDRLPFVHEGVYHIMVRSAGVGKPR